MAANGAVPAATRVTPNSGQALSRRQAEIVALVERGMPNKEIAFELGLAEGTIKEYLHHITAKTGRNRVQLAVWSFARRHGLAEETPKSA